MVLLWYTIVHTVITVVLHKYHATKNTKIVKCNSKMWHCIVLMDTIVILWYTIVHIMITVVLTVKFDNYYYTNMPNTILKYCTVLY